MAPARHHTVSGFLIDRFARLSDKGRRVCQLDKTSGAATQISPRDATVVKHFYSLETGDGRDPSVEELLAKIESAVAPIIDRLTQVGPDGLAERDELPFHEHAVLALFLALARLRTPIWREQTKAIAEQLVGYVKSERLDPGLVGDVEWAQGSGTIEMPKNALIKDFMSQAPLSAWILCLLNWTFVRTERVPFILGDTPVSVFDPTPKFRGSAGGPLSSPNSEMFLPVRPRLGILTKPNPTTFTSTWDAVELMAGMTVDERAHHVDRNEGDVGEAIIDDSYAHELNLRTYAHAQRFVYGSQEAVCATHRAAKANLARAIVLAPKPPRLHILEDDPAEPGLMRAIQVFAAPTELPRRQT